MRFFCFLLIFLTSCGYKSETKVTLSLFIDQISNQTTVKNSSLSGIPFSISSTTPDALCSSLVQATSSDEAIVKNLGLEISGVGSSCYLDINPENNATGVVLISLNLTNGSGTKSISFNLTINNVDIAPVASNLIPVAFDEDIESLIDLVYNDVEGDLATSCSLSSIANISITTPCSCALGTCRVGVTGSSQYSGSASFNYTVTANGSTSNSASVSLSINAVDDAPVVSDFTIASFNENTQQIVTLNYTDVESDAATTCSVSNLTNLTETQTCACASGVCTVGVTGVLNYIGAASFNFTVSANGRSSTAKTATTTLLGVPAKVADIKTDNSSFIYSQYLDGDPVLLEIKVQFSKTVIVTGSPRLYLNVTPADVFSIYATGSGTNTLTFYYNPQLNHFSDRLEHQSTTGLTLNGGTIKDANGTNVNLTLPAFNSTSLYSTNIGIDVVAPTQPSNRSWLNTTVYDSTAIAAWISSSSTDVDQQWIQFFSGANCDTYLSALNVNDPYGTSKNFTIPSFGGKYSYKLQLNDLAGNTSLSSCSEALTVPRSVTGKTGSVQVQNESACALVNGGVQCWGKNQFGILGTGNTTATNTPVQVTGLASGVQAIAVGYYHACAIVDGAAKCWGANTSGQVGDGTQTNRTTPVAVSGLSSGVHAIAAGQFFTCALQNGVVKCWGRNEFGQIGYSGVAVGAASYQLTPIEVSVLGSNVQDIKAFGDNVCALTNGKVYCWGSNSHGQLGNNTLSDSNIPVQVKDTAGTAYLTDVQSLSVGGFHACAIISGGLKCWGRNTYYELGDSTNTQRLLPVSATGLTSGVQEVSAGHLHTCVIVDGVPKCWGYNASGQVGNNVTTTQTSPTNVLDSSLASLSGAQSISAGQFGGCANINGSIQCWGYNISGTLGNGTNTSTTTSVQVSGLVGGLQDFAVGAYHSCAVVNGGVQCWGRNSYGQLGDGTITDKKSPVIALASGVGAQAVAVGDFHTCAIVNGGVQCWGLNDKNQISAAATGYFTTPQSFTQMSGATNFTSGVQTIVAGAKFNCAQKSGKIFCWGDNSDGVFNAGVGGQSADPFQVTATSQYLLAASAGSAYSTRGNGQLKYWGTNNAETTANYNSPMNSVYGINPGIQSMAVSDSHACAVRSGLAECWGLNLNGALGDGTAIDSQGSQVQVSGLTSGVQDIAVTEASSCAIVNGMINCWGDGFGATPVLTNITSGAQKIKGNGARNLNNNMCALVNGALFCWGSNDYGQLGDGTNIDRAVDPAQILFWQ